MRAPPHHSDRTIQGVHAQPPALPSNAVMYQLLPEPVEIVGHEVQGEPLWPNALPKGLKHATAILKPAMANLAGLGPADLVDQIAVTHLLDRDAVAAYTQLPGWLPAWRSAATWR